MFLRGLLILPFLFVAASTYAQEDEDFTFPDEIAPLEYTEKFYSLREDSMQKIKSYAVTLSEDDDRLYQYVRSDSVFVIIKTAMGWRSLYTGQEQSYLFGSGAEYDVVNIDNNGKAGLLVSNQSNASRGGRYDGYDYYSTSYKLVVIDNGKVFWLGTSYRDEAHWYEGYKADDATDAAEEKEMEEMDKEENWKRKYVVFEYGLNVTPGKLRFEISECAGCGVAGIDTVSAIDYIWDGNKLIKDKVIPVKE